MPSFAPSEDIGEAKMLPTHEQAEGHPLLVVVLNVGIMVDHDQVFMDIKAVDGLKIYASLWPGPVRCISRASDPSEIGYGQWYIITDLPFEPVMVGSRADALTIMEQASDASLILAGADNYLDLDLIGQDHNIPVVLTIEYTLRTRLIVLWLSKDRVWQKIKSALWLLSVERQRVSALTRAAGLQANGMPAYQAYGPKNLASMLYFDTRLGITDFISTEEVAAKVERLNAKRPLRLVFTGRLEAMKGVEDLITLMSIIRGREKILCSLDIYGKGVLKGILQSRINSENLSDWIKINDPIDFNKELVPIMRKELDIFVCCHPQADPSCTYLETLGCGVPIVGYSNQAFNGVLSLGPCGISVPMRDIEAMASTIEKLDADRSLLTELVRGATKVASTRLFEMTFKERVDHMRAIAAKPARRG